MPAQGYKVWAFGDRVGIGATDAYHVGIAGIAKKASAPYPYIVANELICSTIARALLLPCPPGDLITHGGDNYFFALNFNLAGATLPPIDPAELVTANPRLAWGITLFDALIINPDRHTSNISRDDATGRVQIFDHSHAFASPSGDISARLDIHMDLLGIGGHCLASALNSTDGRDEWLARIETLPDYLLDGVVEAACEVGLPLGNRNKCQAFLKRRRSILRDIVNQNMTTFPNVQAVIP